MARLNRRFRKSKKLRKNPDSGFKANPPLLSEISEFVVPGFGAFALTRFGTRIAHTQVEKWQPTWGKHAAAATSIGAFLAAYFLAHKWRWLSKYSTPIVVGSAIAAIQSLMQLYLPRLGWCVSDATPELDTSSTTTSSAIASTAMPTTAIPAGMTAVDDDPNAYVYNDQYDAGIYAGSSSSSATGTSSSASSSAPDDDADIDVANQSTDNLGSLGF